MEPEIRPVRSLHRAQLKVFSCATPFDAAAKEVQKAIRDDLADVLDLVPTFRVLGLWEGNDLVALVASEPDPVDPSVWWSTLLGVRPDRRRRGYGRRLKEALLQLALDGGVRLVASKVRFDNDAMLELNREFGAAFEVERPSGEFVLCAIRIR